MYHLSTPEIKKTLRKHIKIIFLNSGDSNLRFHGHYRKADLCYKCTALLKT